MRERVFGKESLPKSNFDWISEIPPTVEKRSNSRKNSLELETIRL
jgi:hypothetical protein